MKATFDTESLRAIVAGADLGSFSRAAVQLGRSQSAISMQLKKLEQQAGTQLFERQGRGLAPTEAGETLIAYARRIVAMNDEAAAAVGATVSTAIVRLGLPQDFFNDVMPAALKAFSQDHPNVQVDVRVGDNHKLSEEVRTGRLDGAIAFFEEGASHEGELLCALPMRWLAHETYARPITAACTDLVMFDHPCLFRKAALATLDRSARRWRIAMTTPSLLYVWSALRSHLGIGVRTEHGLPRDIVCLDDTTGLPQLPTIELRLLRANNASTRSRDLCDILHRETNRFVAPG